MSWYLIGSLKPDTQPYSTNYSLGRPARTPRVVGIKVAHGEIAGSAHHLISILQGRECKVANAPLAQRARQLAWEEVVVSVVAESMLGNAPISLIAVIVWGVGGGHDVKTRGR